eukprot:CAMPEP_0185037942 /NCGR_PEP_ID=MMETSP1103-20130426/32999_1 /TAXON_ID=36769 /ORGANISM="Paraphysomonas bandaiensis, Strain Caron Lab Isolate" /LENGTH=1795 /DNA_ID=CAMNT_0027576163 /DNA_START=144 /DNA_END=5534 /DNA_ORIENTATION=-
MSAKSLREKQAEERERGFTTHFAGANSTGKPVSVKPVVKGMTFQHLAPKGGSEGSSKRRGWAADAPKFIVGQGGPVPIKVGRGGHGISPRNAHNVDRQETHWDEGGYDDGDEVDEEEGVSGGDDNEESFIMEDSLRDPDDEDDDGGDYDEDFEEEDDEDFDESEEIGLRDRVQSGGRSTGSWGTRPVNNTTPVSKVPATSPITTPPANDIRVVSSKVQATTPPVAVPAPLRKSVSMSDVEREGGSSARELEALRSEYNHSTKSQKALMRDSLEDSVHHHPSSVSNTTENTGDPSVVALASRLASLSAAQQNQLLAMLNKLESGSGDTPLTPTPGKSTAPTNTGDLPPSPAKSPKKKKKRSPRRKKDKSNRSTELSMSTSVGAVDCETANRTGFSVLEEDMQKECPSGNPPSVVCPSSEDKKISVGEPCDKPSTDLPKTPVTIKIKLHNCWKKTRHGVLSAMRLLVRQTDTEIDLSSFTVQVSSGNTVLPKSSEVVHSIPSLITHSRVVKRKDWRFPVGVGMSTQLVFTGNISVPVDDLELLVWNGIGDATSSPVQDTDVYVDGSLVWSGVLEEAPKSDDMDTTIASDPRGLRGRELSPRLLACTHGGGRPPSNTIPLCAELAQSKKKTVRTTVPPLGGIRESRPESMTEQQNTTKTDVSLNFSGLSSASSVGMSTTDFLNMEGTTGKERAKESIGKSSTKGDPDWLSDLKTPRDGIASEKEGADGRSVGSVRHVDIFAEDGMVPLGARGSRPGSRRRGNDSGASNEVKRTPNDGFGSDYTPPDAERGTNTEDNSSSTKKASRGSRRRGGGESVSASPPCESLDAKRTQRQDIHQSGGRRKSRRETQKEEEESLRQSLEALRNSDRRNRGRLEQELHTVGGGKDHSNSGIGGMPQISETGDDDGEGGSNAIPVSLESTTAVNISNMRMRALEQVSGGALDKELGKMEGNQKSMLRQRSQRIDQVQETVSSALASLAGVMATLPGAPKGEPEHAKLQLSSSRPNLDSESVSMAPQTSNLDVANPPDDPMANINIDDLLADSFMESSVCEIPVMPKGRVFEIEILSTWGDPYYVGLNGIDIFDHEGNILLLDEDIVSIMANPSDINVLPEYNDDPRKVENILDGNNFTRDDLHVWLAPHGTTMTPKLTYAATITITFSKFTTLSLVRVWNYNKSRTHCYRGVRRCRMKLDSRVIFEGEIRAAPGVITNSEDCSEVILFSTDTTALGKIASYDASVGYYVAGGSEEESSRKWLETLKERKADTRPRTADKGSGSKAGNAEVLTRRKHAPSKPSAPFEAVVDPSKGRPVTAAVRSDSISSVSPPVPSVASHIGTTLKSEKQLESESIIHAPESSVDDGSLVECRVLTFVIERTWGDKCYVGLAGLEVLIGSSCIVADIDPKLIDASPRDLSVIGCFDDPRTPDKLVDGVNDSTDDTHMWLIPYSKGSTHELKIDMGSRCKVAGFNVWNYNKSPEDALRGARVVAVSADGVPLGRCELRIAPGCDGVVYRQQIMLKDIKANALVSQHRDVRYITPSVRQDYEVPMLPSGSLWRFNLYCNWGDGYYIGLDGLEFLDEHGTPIPLESPVCRVTACPHSLLDIGMDDSRVPSNLARSPMHDSTGGMAWLAPLSQCMTEEERVNCLKRVSATQRTQVKPTKSHHDVYEEHEPLFYDDNTLFVMFDRPVTVSVIRFYNYSKSPKRGVREVGIDVDGSVVFMGTLRSSDSAGFNPSDGQSVVFTNDPKLTRPEKSKVCYCGSGEQDVLCINERQVIVRSKAMYEQPNVSTEGIYSDLSNRPTTSHVT